MLLTVNATLENKFVNYFAKCTGKSTNICSNYLYGKKQKNPLNMNNLQLKF